MKDIMGEAIVVTVETTEEIGKRKYKEFKKSTVINVTQKLEDAVTKARPALFKETNTKAQSSKSESKNLKLHI